LLAVQTFGIVIGGTFFRIPQAVGQQQKPLRDRNGNDTLHPEFASDEYHCPGEKFFIVEDGTCPVFELVSYRYSFQGQRFHERPNALPLGI
jgi:hypothetical protein